VDEFIEIVQAQGWRHRPDVQLLIKDEQDDRFTVHTLSDLIPDR
jgi:hypothetical protein